MADCETEPESTGKPAAWEDPTGRDPDRRYLLDQTQGLLGNLAIIRSQAFDFISISGDLVEDAGDQADWDEWWRWFATSDGDSTVAGRIPLLVAPGNHEYWAGPAGGGYEQPASERAIARYATYFERLGDGRPRSQQARAQAQTRAAGDASGGGADGESGGASPRYGRLDFGPVALLALDVTNDSPHRTARDTNYHLLGARDPGGGSAPSFQPGSAQYAWLEANLADAQATCAFTFVLLHHVPYSSGPHGWPPGVGPGLDEQSGVPVRALTALLVRYGVDAVLAGHDEMYERSEIAGQERLPDGTSRSHTLHVYDVGICGDGLRSPQRGLDNPRQRFVAHRDAPEVWRNGVLIEGGKHYGHLDVQVAAAGDGWRATLTPVYALPQLDEDGALIGVQRRIYDDVVILSAP
jgi:3',5'-cyclic AMP phosphodiesterase CpdA